MSDPVTNVEIEDVLSSIRRLVSDGDKARTRDPAPVEPEEDTPVVEAEEAAEVAESSGTARPEKLVLSPAFMIVDNGAADEAGDEGAQDEAGAEQAEAEAEGSAPQEADAQAEPFVLPDPITPDENAPDEGVSDAGEAEAKAEAETEIEAKPETEAETPSVAEASDRASLVATIAELEAAVSGSDDEYELDGSELPNETIAWPGAMVRNLDDVEDAMTEDHTPEEVPEAAPEAASEEAPEEEASDSSEAQPEPAFEAEPTQDTEPDVYADDDLDDLLETGGVSIDEEALREMVAAVVREELTGPLGERITRNVRKLVRREIYRILSSQDFD